MEAIQQHLDEGMDPDASQKQNGNTPLLEATTYGQEDIVELLLDKKANINHQNKKGQTALDLSVAFKRSEIRELIIKQGGKTGTR